MTQHFTERDFANMTTVRIEGDHIGDGLTNSINFVTDFFSFGLQKSMDSLQDIITELSPSQRQPSIFRTSSTRIGHPADDPVFIADNPQDDPPQA